MSHKRSNLSFRTVPVASLLSIVAAMGSFGCAGTSPQLSTPQMNTPTLDNGGVSAGNRSAGGGAGGAAASDAKMPALEKVETPKGLFTIEPYIQLGNSPTPGNTEAIVLHWTMPDSGAAPAATATPAAGASDKDKGDDKALAVEIRSAGATAWQKLKTAPTARRLAIPGTPAQTFYTATVTDLVPGGFFDYRLMQKDKPVFIGRTRSRKPAGQPVRFVVFGDTAEGNADQKKITYQAAQAKPDFVFITGDIVYDRGRASEYLDHFFPIFNADTASATTGAPLLRSTLFMAAVGNHDTGYQQLDKWPDGLAYFYFWDLPKNGPPLAVGARNTPVPTGDDSAKKALIDAAGDAYPSMENYSFDYGSTHWLVLDSNAYADWSSDKLRAWVEKDLSGAKNAVWKFVAFHHPPFHSSETHKDDQFMRVLCDLFEKYSVDIVWSGHVHNYQRSYPMQFTAVRGPSGLWRDDAGRVAGKWTLDKSYDGEKNTKPAAPIYIVTGGGGAGLYDAKTENAPNQWQEFTAKYIASTHSLTVVDIDGPKMTVRQLSDAGKELDKFVLTK